MAAIVCKGCCGAIGNCFRGCGRAIEEICCGDRPFPACPVFTAFVNTLPSFFFIGAAIVGSDCPSEAIVYLIVTFILCLSNTAMAFYLYWKFALSEGANSENAAEKGWKLLCYDFVVYFYLWVWGFECGWVIFGIVIANGIEDEDCDDSGLVKTAVWVSVILMGIYLWLGAAVAYCCVFCESCRESFGSGRNRDTRKPY